MAGGVHLSLGYVKMFTENITAGRGFFAYTAVVFGHANPFAAALASFVFGLAEVVTFRVQNLNLPGRSCSPFPISSRLRC